MLFQGPSTRMLHMQITTSPLVKTYTLQEFWELPMATVHVGKVEIKAVRLPRRQNTVIPLLFVIMRYVYKNGAHHLMR